MEPLPATSAVQCPLARRPLRALRVTGSVGQGLALVGHHCAAVEPLLDLHLSAGVAGPDQLEAGGAVEVDGVVVGHSADVLEAQDGIEADAVWELAIGGAWLCWGDSESLVVARQEVPEHLVGLLDG